MLLEGCDFMSTTMWVIVGVVFVGIVIYAIVSVNVGEKKGETSKAKLEIHSFIEKELGSSAVSLYASYVNHEHYRGATMSSTTTTALYYALGFDPTKDALYLADIFVDEEDVSFSNLVCYDKKNLGRVTYVGTYFCLFDKSDEKIVEVCVDPLNTKMGVECLVNVTQREEWNELQEFLPQFAEAINDANEVPKKYRKWGTMRKDLKNKKSNEKL